MRRIVGSIFQSLDGVMQAPGGPREDTSGGFALGGWQMAFTDPVMDDAMQALLAPPYALLLGRRTYDIFASYWPFVDGDEAALGEAFTKADKFVLTRGSAPLAWENSYRLADIDAVAALKAGDGPELRIWGSSLIYPALLGAGLLDQLILLTYPVLLGSGKRTFADGTPPSALRMVSHAVGPSGAIAATLEPAGDVQTQTGHVAPPNARETERQRRMDEGVW